MTQRFHNLIELLESTFAKYKNEPAYSCAGKTLSFAEIDELSLRFASYLQHDLGLTPGDRVALQMPNVLQFPVAFYGALRAGMIVVNTNPLYTDRELKHQFKDSGAKVLVVLANMAHCAASIVEETDIEHVIVTQFADLHSSPKRWLINAVIKYVKKMVPAFSFKSMSSFRKATEAPARELNPFSTEEDEVVILQYTGGTTGVSKGAMLTHRNLCSNIWQIITQIPKAFDSAQETLLACLPLYHIYAMNLHGIAGFSSGGHNVLVPNPRDINSVVQAMATHRISVFVGLNTLFIALCRNQDFCRLDFSSLEVTSSGGMALTADTANLWHKTTGCKVCEGYGLTETSPVVASNLCEDPRIGSIGLPVPETDIKVVDEQGQELPTGSPGELCVRGPQVMKGYWQRPKETDNALSADGWLKTGDIVVVEEDGYIKVVDRKKDMILVSGFNVYPNEIEDIVTQHPDIIEAAAVGMKDPESGEVVKLFVVTDNKNLSVEEVRGFCREKMTGYKVPKAVEFIESLPKSNVGKIMRRELRG